MSNLDEKRCLLITSPYCWGGGIKTMVDEAYIGLLDAGFKVDILMPYFPGNKRVHKTANYISTPKFIDFDLFPFIHHLYFGVMATKIARKYSYHFGVVATSHTMLPVAFLNKRFSFWVATVYSDELESKYNSLAGDDPARKLRNSIQWPILEYIEKYVYKQASTIYAISDYTAKKIEFLTKIKAKKRIQVLTPPIDNNLFKNTNGFKKNTNSIIFTGRIEDPRKNVIFLLESMQIIAKEIPNVKLTVVGGTATSEIKNIINKLGISRNVKFIDYIDRKKIPELLKRNNLFACTSTQEGLCISILEAMSCGLPIITTKCGGPETIVKKSKGGIVTDFNIEDFANATISLLKDYRKLCQYSQNASSYVHSITKHSTFSNLIANSLSQNEQI